MMDDKIGLCQLSDRIFNQVWKLDIPEFAKSEIFQSAMKAIDDKADELRETHGDSEPQLKEFGLLNYQKASWQAKYGKNGERYPELHPDHQITAEATQ